MTIQISLCSVHTATSGIWTAETCTKKVYHAGVRNGFMQWRPERVLYGIKIILTEYYFFNFLDQANLHKLMFEFLSSINTSINSKKRANVFTVLEDLHLWGSDWAFSDDQLSLSFDVTYNHRGIRNVEPGYIQTYSQIKLNHYFQHPESTNEIFIRPNMTCQAPLCGIHSATRWCWASEDSWIAKIHHDRTAYRLFTEHEK